MGRQSPLYAVQKGAGATFEQFAGWTLPAHFGDEAAEYEAACSGVALIDLSHRSKVELAGDDRAAFLHNLCTNDIKALAPGTGCEAFLTSPQAKILGHVYVFATPATLVLDTVPGQGAELVKHLDRFLFRDKVELADHTEAWAELLLTGPGAEELLRGAGAVAPAALLEHIETTLGDTACFVRRTDLTGAHAFQVVADAKQGADIWQQLTAAGAMPAGLRAFETLRVEAGTPLYGVDITDDNLPQEIGRDAQAISFTKGCYIGQETVARIDTYGHVNRSLVGLKLQGQAGAGAGSAIRLPGEEKEVGRVTSSVDSPRLKAAIALGYVRRGSEQPGTQLEVAGAGGTLPAEVVVLPFVTSAGS